MAGREVVMINAVRDPIGPGPPDTGVVREGPFHGKATTGNASQISDGGHVAVVRRRGLDDMHAIEVNEALASVPAAWQRELDADLVRVSRHGGSTAIGHPLGASGARLLTTSTHQLEPGGLALAVMCCGGGFGTETFIESTQRSTE